MDDLKKNLGNNIKNKINTYTDSCNQTCMYDTIQNKKKKKKKKYRVYK